jgi:hypothetical protein
MGVCELDNDVEAQAMVNKATFTCGVFNNVMGRFCFMHDEEFVEKKNVLVQAFEEWNVKMF